MTNTDPHIPQGITDPKDVRIVRIIDKVSEGAETYFSKDIKKAFSVGLSAAGLIIAFLWLSGFLYRYMLLEKAGLPPFMLSMDLTSAVGAGYLALLIQLAKIELTKYIFFILLGILPIILLLPPISAWIYVRFRKRVRRYIRYQILIKRSTLRKGIYKSARFYVAYFWILARVARAFSFYIVIATASVLIVAPVFLAQATSSHIFKITNTNVTMACNKQRPCIVACVEHRLTRRVFLVGDATTSVFRTGVNSYQTQKNDSLQPLVRGVPGGTC